MRRLIALVAAAIGMSLAQAGPKEEAMQVVEKWSKAFADADLDGIMSLYASDALFFGTLDKTLTTQPAGIREYFERALFFGRPRTATLQDHSVATLGDSLVVVAGLDMVTGTRDGKVVSAPGRITFVLEKRAGDWKIIHFHRSPVPN